MISLLTSAFRKSTPDEYASSLTLLDDVVFEAVLIRLIEAIPEDKLHEFEAAVTLSDPRILEAFILEEIPNSRSIIAETVRELQKETSDLMLTLTS